jgi:hypothetical protein
MHHHLLYLASDLPKQLAVLNDSNMFYFAIVLHLLSNPDFFGRPGAAVDDLPEHRQVLQDAAPPRNGSMVPHHELCYAEIIFLTSERIVLYIFEKSFKCLTCSKLNKFEFCNS